MGLAAGRATPARRARAGVAMPAFAALLAFAAPAFGDEPWAGWVAPDSALPAALQSGRANFEANWNALMLAELRARAVQARRADTLLRLAMRVARAETPALGSTIGPDAMKLRARWTPGELRSRAEAALAESLGTVAEFARRPDEADSLYRAALGRYRALGEKRRTAWVLGSMGRNAFSAGRDLSADSLVREALAARRALGDARMTGASLFTLSSIAIRLQRWQDAKSFAAEARDVRIGTREWAGLGQSLNNLAYACQQLGERDSALVNYERGLGYTVAAGDSGRTLELLRNFGAMLARVEGDPRAEPMLRRALALAIQRNDDAAETHVRRALVDLYAPLGRYAEARETLEDGAAAAERSPAIERARRLLQLGRVAVAVKDPQAARPPLEQALALCDEPGASSARTFVLTNLATVSRLSGDLTGAARLGQSAIDDAIAQSNPEGEHAAAVTLGEIAWDRGDFAAAETWFERAAKLARESFPVELPSDLVNLASVARRTGRLELAESRAREALTLGESRGNTDAVAAALIGLADAREAAGDLPGARAYARRAASEYDALRSRQAERQAIALLARRRFAVEHLIHLLTKNAASQPESAFDAEAFEWAERARSRALLDLVSAREGGAKLATLAEARQRFGSKESALLEFSVGDSSTTLWVVTRGGASAISLPARAALLARVSQLRRGLADPARAESRSALEAAHALYRMAIEPALPFLKGVRHLVISPDGPLQLVPFEALLAVELKAGDSGDPRPPAPGDWLASRWSTSYAFSASTLASRPDAAAGRGIVAVADARFAGRLPALPETARELRLLEALARSRPIVTLSGAGATREAMLGLEALPHAAIVHIATHGEANESEPERSGLWLSPAAGDTVPGYLSVADIRALRLDASLVTLSACETGLGRLERGEGVVGLTRAFVAAGARSVLVSLWKVNDRSTSDLMQAFYEGLLAKGLPGDEALARARRTLMKRPETSSPFHWAAFVLVGESTSIP